MTPGSWIQTYTGGKAWPMEPRVEDIGIEDIAHALSLICRFGGHCNSFYSVAQHSVLVSRVVKPENALAGLLHDAAETYLGDMVRPLKQAIPEYRRIEQLWERCIDKRFDLKGQFWHSAEDIKRADNILLATERRDLLADGPGRWLLHEEPLPFKIVPLDWLKAEKLFKTRYLKLVTTTK